MTITEVGKYILPVEESGMYKLSFNVRNSTTAADIFLTDNGHIISLCQSLNYFEKDNYEFSFLGEQGMQVILKVKGTPNMTKVALTKEDI